MIDKIKFRRHIETKTISGHKGPISFEMFINNKLDTVRKLRPEDRCEVKIYEENKWIVYYL